MAAQEEFRQALLDGDFRKLVAMWAAIFPHLPAPANDEQAEACMHQARTAANSLPLRARAYSHRWLTERLLPTHLPDSLRPAADRLYPQVAKGVLISVKATSDLMRPIIGHVRTSMEHAVLEAEADGRLDDSPYVKGRMTVARERTVKALLGV